MKYLKLTFIMLLIGVSSAIAQRQFLTYQELGDFLQASPGAFRLGLGGYANPALLSYSGQPEFMIAMNNLNDNLKEFNNYGIFTSWGNLGFGMVQSEINGKVIDEYRLSTGFGNKTFSLGLGYGWANGALGSFNRLGSMWYAGLLYRPNEYFSLGLQESFAAGGSDKQTVADIAIRPIKDHLLTLFADFSMFHDQNIKDGAWSAGISWEFIDGIRLNARYFDTEVIRLGFDYSMGNTSIAYGANMTNDFQSNYDVFSIRTGAKDRVWKDKAWPKINYLKLDLRGGLKYKSTRSFSFFTETSRTLFDVLHTIDLASKDNNIAGIVINTSGMKINKEMLWEIREKLSEFKNLGKEVIIYMDRGSISEYHFASIADKIIMDPQGGVSIPGYALGRSYYKNLMEKVGIGVEEFRYFKYKSAYENFSRDKMSEGDREQRQKIIDDWYATTKEEICKSRNFSEDEFEGIVNGEMVYMPETALEKKMIDKIGRWTNIDKLVRGLSQEVDNFVWPGSLSPSNKLQDDHWGEPKKVAVVYVIGACAMDEGIKARQLAGVVENAITSPGIEAVVLRVDSPGGDAMASDYIAEVVRKHKGKKPIIVSQGYVAGSGGYWLSMDADKIVASPYTITGSIGVIGMWLYDNGLKDDLGITTDLVKVGKYSDLGFAYSLPLIGVGLPDRNLSEDELKQREKMIKVLYKDFVSKVADGRGMEEEEVEKIAQGRIWSGTEGKKIGLVDEIGGLETAIRIAKQDAGIGEDERCDVLEYYIQDDMDFSSMMPSLFNVEIPKESAETSFVKFLLNNNGSPMPILPLEFSEMAPKE